jgi:hypothetical protein
LHRPSTLADHRDQLLSRVDVGDCGAQQLRRPRPSRNPEHDQGPVTTGTQLREQLVEPLVGDTLRRPIQHLRPIPAAALAPRACGSSSVRPGRDRRRHVAGGPTPAAESVKSTGAQLVAAFPPRPVVAAWPATEARRSGVADRVLAAPFALDNPLSQRNRRLGVLAMLGWLRERPGDSWQQEPGTTRLPQRTERNHRSCANSLH